MVIVMCATRNWYFYVAVELYALFKHNKVKKVYLFIEDDDISYITDERITYINVNKIKEYIAEDSPNYNTSYTKLSYLRCYFTKYIQEDKILYIDADAIVVDNIQELWDAPLNDDVLIGVHEDGDWDRHLNTYGMKDNYINSGVLVMDLKKIRDEKLDDSMIYLLNNNKYAFPDQDVINLVCRNRIKRVSNIYNSTETTGMVDNAKIIHYIRGRRGWVKGSPRSEIWYNYHNEYLEKEGIMNNYKVKAIRNFNDYEGKDINNPNNKFVERKANISEWWCDAKRYEYLKQNNAVELIEVKPIEEKQKEKTAEKLVEDKAEEIEDGTLEHPYKTIMPKSIREEKPKKKSNKK